MLTDKEIKDRIIRKICTHGNWGSSHTLFENLKKGLTQRNTGSKIDKMGGALIKDNLILSKPTRYGSVVSLNLKMNEEIQAHLEE